MKDFDSFVAELIAALTEAGLSVKTTDVAKNNVRKTGIGLDNVAISPTVYADELYKAYTDGLTVGEIAAKAKTLLTTAPMPSFDVIEWISSYDNVKDRVVYILAGKKGYNLETLPHRIVEGTDLVMIYKIILPEELSPQDSSIASITIHEGLRKMLGITEDELYECAKMNTPVHFPALVKSIAEVLMETYGDSIPFIPLYDEVGMTVISNKTRLNGAGVILYDGVLKNLAEQFGKDLAIIPSSIHECIALPIEKGMVMSNLLMMNDEVNATELPPEEVLSTNVYIYSRENDSLKAFIGSDGAAA